MNFTNNGFKYSQGVPNLPNMEEFEGYLKEIVNSRRLTNNGPFVQQLEKEIADYVGVNHCIAISSCTMGLYIAMKFLKEARNIKRIWIPTFTFIGAVSAAEMAGLDIVFYGLDSKLQPWVEGISAHAGDAVMAANLFGSYCGSINDFKNHGIPVIFDSAHALGVDRYGRKIGSYGLCEVFSLHSTKIVQGFEGGLITTNDDHVAAFARRTRNFGYEDLPIFYKEVLATGCNAKLSEVHAAMALANFHKIDDLIKHNEQIYLTYQKAFATKEGDNIGFKDSDVLPGLLGSNHHYHLVKLHDKHRRVRLLMEKGILLKSYFYPCHLWPAYLGKYQVHGDNDQCLTDSNALSAYNTYVTLPGGSITVDQANEIASAIKNTCY